MFRDDDELAAVPGLQMWTAERRARDKRGWAKVKRKYLNTARMAAVRAPSAANAFAALMSSDDSSGDEAAPPPPPEPELEPVEAIAARGLRATMDALVALLARRGFYDGPPRAPAGPITLGPRLVPRPGPGPLAVREGELLQHLADAGAIQWRFDVACPNLGEGRSSFASWILVSPGDRVSQVLVKACDALEPFRKLTPVRKSKFRAFDGFPSTRVEHRDPDRLISAQADDGEQGQLPPGDAAQHHSRPTVAGRSGRPRGFEHRPRPLVGVWDGGRVRPGRGLRDPVPAAEVPLALLREPAVRARRRADPRGKRYGDVTARRGLPQVTTRLTEDDVFWMFAWYGESRAASKLRRDNAASRDHEPSVRSWVYQLNLACFRLESDLDTPGSGVDFEGLPDPAFYRERLDARFDSSETESASDSEESEAAVSGDEVDEVDDDSDRSDALATDL